MTTEYEALIQKVDDISQETCAVIRANFARVILTLEGEPDVHAESFASSYLANSTLQIMLLFDEALRHPGTGDWLTIMSEYTFENPDLLETDDTSPQ